MNFLVPLSVIWGVSF